MCILYLSKKKKQQYDTGWFSNEGHRQVLKNAKTSPQLCGVANSPDSKVHGANMGPTWGRQDPGVSHVGHVNFAVWASNLTGAFDRFDVQILRLLISRFQVTSNLTGMAMSAAEVAPETGWDRYGLPLLIGFCVLLMFALVQLAVFVLPESNIWKKIIGYETITPTPTQDKSLHLVVQKVSSVILQSMWCKEWVMAWCGIIITKITSTVRFSRHAIMKW